jgi:hypothetical protein
MIDHHLVTPLFVGLPFAVVREFDGQIIARFFLQVQLFHILCSLTLFLIFAIISFSSDLKPFSFFKLFSFAKLEKSPFPFNFDDI